MMSMKAILSLALLAVTTSVSAQTLAVSAGNVEPVAAGNDFRTVPNGLDARNLRFYSTNRTITLTQPSVLRFLFLGSESGYQNRFTSGTITWLEVDGAGTFITPLAQGSYFAPAGSYRPFFNTPSGGVTTNPSSPGDAGFGIFLTSNSGAAFTASNLVFGYDDPTGSPDRDYDDFMVQVFASAAPEPAAWAMMLVGFGLCGVAIRRRSPPIRPAMAAR